MAASCLGYIVPVAIYLKTHEDKVRSMFSGSNIVTVHLSGSDEWSGRTKTETSVNQRDFDSNIIFFIMLGVFGACSLVVGLCIEMLSLFGVTEEIDPTVNY